MRVDRGLGARAHRLRIGRAARIGVAALLSCLVTSCALGGSEVRAAEPEPAPAAPAAANPEPVERSAPETWHATTFVSGRRGYRMIYYWSKGANMRAETLIAGHPFLTIVRGDRYIAIDRLRGVGIDVQRAPRAIALDGQRERPFGNELTTLIREGGEKVEDTRSSGVDTEFWRVTDTQGRRSLWLSAAEPRIPVRFEVYLRSSAETITTEYANWVLDIEIPDSFFTPQGIALERYDYETFVTKSLEGPVARVPVLYPDLLHGEPAP